MEAQLKSCPARRSNDPNQVIMNSVQRKWRASLFLLACAVLTLTACSQANQEFNQGKKAEAIKDYDTAVVHYQRALRANPTNVEYQLKVDRMRFEAGQSHVEEGQKLRQKGDLQLALAEFQKAMMIDPSSPVAQQETQQTMDALAARQAAQAPASAAPPATQEPQLMQGPPQLKPLSRAPINLKMTNDVKMIFETVAKLAGLTVVFDPDFASRRVSIELTNVTIEQALDIISLEAKAFWKPVTNDIIFVAPDQPQKRRDYEEEIVRTIYLRNTILPQDLTEIVNALRQLLDLRRVQQFNGQNAIIVRDTPDKVMLAEKIINDIDKPKPEVVVQFAVLQARRDRLRDLGINPGTTAALAFTPPSTTSTTSSSSTTGTNSTSSLPLNQLRTLGSADYSLTLPGATATALLTDSTTQIIDDPQIRIVDGQDAKLRIGDRVPVATGSFQAGVGVGTTGAAGSVINPLVNTQFQYLDVGVIVDVTPRIHPDYTVSLKLSVEVSSVTGQENIGGINQPVISTRRIEHDVRLQDGEVNILGGLVENTTTRSTSGWPGFSQIPFLRYFTADNQLNTAEQEVLIVVIPHVIRMPSITAENLRSIASGTDTNPEVELQSAVQSPPVVPAAAPATPPAAAPAAPAAPATAAPAPAAPAPQAPTPQLGFQPANVSLKPGETATIGMVIQNAQDLFSVPLLLQYNPAVISVEDVRQGGFLSGGTQPIAIVQRVDKERGQAIVSATRMPNTPGVSGSGTLFGVVIRGVAAGTSQLSILQVNARDSQQHPIQFVTSEASVRVAP
jgi:general secretion pathway protein D